MAKNKNRRRAPVARTELSLEVLGADMRQHVEGLGFASVDTYFAWCRSHGFPIGLRKAWQQQRREREHAQRLGGDARLRAGVRVRNPAEAVRRLLAGEQVAGDAFRNLAFALRDPQRSPPQRALLAELLGHLANVAPDSLAPDRPGLRLCCHIAEHHGALVRPLAVWRPRTHNEPRALASLVQHLFARYPAPACLQDAWLDAGDGASLHRQWYLHLVAGNNWRTAEGLPIELTKKMAHECLQAPADLSVAETLRHGQVRGLGGSARLATAIVATRLGSDFAQDDFWRTVILFLIRHGIDDAQRVLAIVDFLHEHRHGNRNVVDDRGYRVELPPPQPNLSMHGRTPESLHKQVQAWHRRLGSGTDRLQHVRWLGSGLPGYHAVADAGGPGECVWSVRELRSALELRHESSLMQHCVFSYVARCVRGETAIFTLTKQPGPQPAQTAATIEVRDRRVVQARGRSNRSMPAAAKEHMRRWVQGAGLTIASWV